jgi:hypothetical protein
MPAVAETILFVFSRFGKVFADSFALKTLFEAFPEADMQS